MSSTNPRRCFSSLTLLLTTTYGQHSKTSKKEKRGGASLIQTIKYRTMIIFTVLQYKIVQYTVSSIILLDGATTSIFVSSLQCTMYYHMYTQQQYYSTAVVQHTVSPHPLDSFVQQQSHHHEEALLHGSRNIPPPPIPPHPSTRPTTSRSTKKTPSV